MLKSLLVSAVALCSAYGGEVQHFPKGKRIDLSNLGFVDNNGKKVLVSDFKGKVVLVDFWVKWCGPCRKSLPELTLLQKAGQEKGNLVVVPCNLDEEDWPQGVYAFMRQNKKWLDGMVYYRPSTGKNGIFTNLGEDIQSYPTTLVIDPTGRLASKWSGYGEGLTVYEINQVIQERP